MIASTDVDDIAVGHDAPAPSATRRLLYLYILPLVGGPLLLFVGALLIVPTQWFALRSGNAYLINLAYGATLRNADCQILVYGDSSAMVGLDPTLVRERTGLSTCNIAEFQPMTLLNGTMVLDKYLEHNAGPRFLVFLFAPENLDIQSQRGNGSFEAITYRMRQPHRLASLLVLAPQYSADLFTWAEQGMRFALQHVFSRPASPEVQHLREASHGQLRLNGQTLTACGSVHHDTSPNKSWIAGLRSKYQRDGTTVLVDAFPVPACDPSLGFFEKHASEVIDNHVETLPINAYTTDGRLHVNATGSQLASERFADQIVQQLEGPPSIGSR